MELSEDLQRNSDMLIELTADVVAAYVSNNPVPVGELPNLIADVHMALIAAATGDKAAVEERVKALMGLVEAGALPAGPVVPAVCRAALAFAEEDYAACARILEPVAAEVPEARKPG